MSLTAFPEPKDLDLKFEDMVLDGRSKTVNPYGVSNPHPGFGKDPNILNEFGHTEYPKMVYPEGPQGPGKVANNKAEEEALLNPSVGSDNKPQAW